MGSTLEVWLAVAVLVIIFLATAAIWISMGRTAGIASGLLLFLILDGFHCLWVLVTHSMYQRIGDTLDAKDSQRLRDGSRGNPTIR